MRIAIDYSAAVNQRAGVGRLVRNQVLALADLDRANDSTLVYARPNNGALAEFPKARNFTRKQVRLRERWLAVLWHRAKVPLPEAAGPSMATTNGRVTGALVRPADRRVMAVLPRIVPAHAIIGKGAARIADRESEPVRSHRMTEVCPDLAARVHRRERRHRHLHNTGDLDRSALAINGVADRHLLHAELVRDQRHESRHRAALGSGEDSAERGGLRRHSSTKSCSSAPAWATP